MTMSQRNAIALIACAAALFGCSASEPVLSAHPSKIAQPLDDPNTIFATISATYDNLSDDARGALGEPTGLYECDRITGGDCAYMLYEGGRIYYQSGHAFAMYGAIYRRWLNTPNPEGEYGLPITDETETPDGRGRYNHFDYQSGASIYWTPEHGAVLITSFSRDYWAQSGWEQGPWGYPTGEFRSNPDKNGRCGPNKMVGKVVVSGLATQSFENGYECWYINEEHWFVPYH